MKRKTSLFILLAGAVLLQACFNNDDINPEKKDRENDQQIATYITSNSLDGDTTSTGLYYSVITALPNNRKPDTAKKEQVYVNYKGSTLANDRVYFDQSKAGRPVIFALNSGQLISGFNEGIGLMHEGEKAILLVPSRLAYGSTAYQGIPAYSNLRFDVELLAVRTEEEALQVFATDSLKLKINFSSLPEGRESVKDTALIFHPASESIYYIRTKKGTGTSVSNGNQVNVRYRGRFIDGSNFAAANSTDQFTYITGGTNRIKGYLDGIGQMKAGEKGVILIPSAQGYGTTGSQRDARGEQAIPGYTPLVFDVEVTEVK